MIYDEEKRGFVIDEDDVESLKELDEIIENMPDNAI